MPAHRATAAAEFTSRWRCGIWRRRVLLARRGCCAAPWRRPARRGARNGRRRSAVLSEFVRQDPSAAALTALGRALFFDPTLVGLGIARVRELPRSRACVRIARTLAPCSAAGPIDGCPACGPCPRSCTTQNMPPFTEHFFDSDEETTASIRGLRAAPCWDGRAQSAHEQARVPLLSEFEMANASADAVVAKVRARALCRRSFAARSARAYSLTGGAPSRRVLLALETFEQSPADFYPYSSKYDAFLRGDRLAQRRRARAAWRRSTIRRGAIARAVIRARSARAHSRSSRTSASPRSARRAIAAIPANADPRYYDLGLCGPLRKDLAGRAEYCGLFRTPTLRNVARKRVVFPQRRLPCARGRGALLRRARYGARKVVPALRERQSR